LDNQHNKEDLIAEIEASRSVEAMCATPGWRIVKEHFGVILKVINEKLLEEKEHQSVIRLQERYRAFRSMLEAAEDFVRIKELRQQELADIELEDKYIKDYGLNN
jgi:hypothetical protein